MIRYQTGDVIRAGDHVVWAGAQGRVLFVLDPPDIPDEWANFAEWAREEYTAGFMLDTAVAGHVFCTTPDEDLELVSRKS